MNPTDLFVSSTVFLLQHSRQVLLSVEKWDESAERFRKAWSEASYSIDERHALFHTFFTAHRLRFFSDGYSWIADDSITLDISFTDQAGKLQTYGSIKIGTCFKTLLELKTQARIDDKIDEEKEYMNKETMIYKALLASVGITLPAESRERQLLGKIMQAYDEDDGDMAGNPMFTKMMGSAGGIFNLIVDATEGNDQVPASLKQTLKGLQSQMAGGMSNPSQMMDMLTSSFNGPEMGDMFAQMKQHAGDSPMMGSLLDMMSSQQPMEQKIMQITEMTSDPRIVEEIAQQMKNSM